METQDKAPQRVDGTGTLSLFRKLAEVMGVVERVPKSGRNEFHKYDYSTEADIVAAVRKAMAERHLVMVPSVLRHEWKDHKNGKDRLCTLTVRFTIHDGDSGEETSFEVLGEGQDQGDKATYKAMTGAVKYALLKLFLIPTGDDPEKDEHESGKEQGGKARERPRQEKPQQPAAGSSKPSDGGPPATAKPTPPPTVAFGPHKGKPISELSDGDLNGAIDLAHAKLLEDPKAKWVPGMRANLTLLEDAAALRVRAPKPTQQNP